MEKKPVTEHDTSMTYDVRGKGAVRKCGLFTVKENVSRVGLLHHVGELVRTKIKGLLTR